MIKARSLFILFNPKDHTDIYGGLRSNINKKQKQLQALIRYRHVLAGQVKKYVYLDVDL